MKSAEQTQALAMVEERANQFRNKAKTLEAQVRAQLKAELQEVQTAVDIAAATAYRAGASKAAVGRALGSQDYNTYNDSIERGLSIVGNSATVGSGVKIKINYEDDVLYVDISRGGESASFVIISALDGDLLLNAVTSLWNEDYTVKNTIVEELDMVDSGPLYDEVSGYVANFVE